MNDEKETALRMQNMASGILKDVYTTIAGDILAWSGISKGILVDIGGGTGQLCLAFAEQNVFRKIINLDCSPFMQELAEKNFHQAGLGNKLIHTLNAFAEDIPLDPDGVDLVISRGSSFAWKDPALALSEIHRILKPGGKAFIGVGCIFGSEKLRDSIIEQFKLKDPQWEEGAAERESKLTLDDLDSLCQKAGVSNYHRRIEGHDKWLVIEK